MTLDPLHTHPGWWGLPVLDDARVLVTGGAGFVGSHLVRLLLACGARVVVLDVAGEPWRLADMAGAVEYVQVDLNDSASLRAIVAEHNPTHVFHLAAYAVQPSQRNWHDAVQANVSATLSIVDACGQDSNIRFVQIGTAHEYGGAEAAIGEDAPLRPVGVYGATKAAGMIVGRARAREVGVEWTGLRPFVAFGPQEAHQKLIPYVLTQALSGRPIETTKGDQIRDFIYVKDLVAGMVHAALAPAAVDEILNLSAGQVMSLADLIREAASLVPGADLRLGARPHRSDHIPVQKADLSKTKRLLPSWQPHYSIRDALQETLNWYRKESQGS